MKNFTNPDTKKGFIHRINKLTPDSKAKWGKMNVAQMLNHLNEFMLIVNDKKEMKQSKLVAIFSAFIGKIIKARIINSNRPLPKNLGNAPLPVANNFEAEKEQLINSITNLNLNQATKKPLSIFGKLSSKEWDNFLSKQFEHHLAQFGV